ncbi:MAG: DUF3365 domain-containing protein [Nitrospirae bacterium]|nr:DUF3365 domain-containing protein [Nitrospirota bacterium]
MHLKDLFAKTKRYPALMLAAWTAAVLLSLAWNIYEIHGDSIEHALTEARTYHELNLSYRKWVSEVGGIYAAVDKVTPNPYLKVPERDVTTTHGARLTLVNPAYMTRLVFAIIGRAEMPVINKLTSLDSINPINAPDEFEKKALLSFEKGLKEANEITTVNGLPYLRLVRPFITETACLKCHGFQGYKEGDIRGGISIAVPMKPYFESEAESRLILAMNHLLLWFLVSAGIVVISGKRLAEQQKMEESEWKFRTLSESSDDWEFWLGEGNTVSFMTPSCRNITGYGPEEFINDPDLISKVIHPDDRDMWVQHLKEFTSPHHDDLEIRIITRTGDIRWLSHKCSPLFVNNRFLGRRASNRDITDRRIAEEKLQNAYQILELVFENTHVLIAVLDREFNFIRVNRAYADSDEKSPEFFPGKSHFDLYPDEENKAIFRRVVATGEPAFFYAKPFEYAEHPERGVTYWDWSLLPIRDNNGSIVGLIFTLLNVTEQKRAEGDRQKLQSQLRQAQKMEEIGQLTGGIAHDFNNILSAIIGYGSLTQMKMPDDDPLKFNIKQILEAADRAAQLTHSLLAFSRKQVLCMKPVALNEVIKKAGKLLVRLIGEDIEFGTCLSNTELMVMADSGQIEQILMNFATNARDAMPQGGMLAIRTEKMTMDNGFIQAHGFGKPGEYALLSVTDTGTGMDEQTRQRIFEPFFTTKEMGRGTGLGLAMVYGIVTQHEGFINVYSEQGKGTTFRIYFPLITAAADERTEADIVCPAGGNETILIAEDDSALRRLSEDVLKEFGYTVISAEDGEDALDKFMANKETISLLVLDMIMPRKNGKEAYEEIRKIRRDIKVLFASGYTADIMQKKGIHEAGPEFITKPFSPIDLLRKIREILDSRQ